jgi:peptidoglycan/LPS O-acetylase OafA/YrhL
MLPVWLWRRRHQTTLAESRVASIDGLRGFLAFFVFLHHSALWYYYLRTGEWRDPPSRLFTHFGQASVALFFMITGFLFFGKLLEGYRRPVDWMRLYIGRLLRLVPLYAVAVSLTMAMVGVASAWTIREPLPVLIEHVVHWGLFTIADAPPVNAIRETSIMIAGVTWSLAYEWFFYALLPMMAVVLRQRPPLAWVLGSAFALVIFLRWGPVGYHLIGFGAGMASAAITRSSRVRDLACSIGGTSVALGALGLALTLFSGTHATLPQLLLGVAFLPIAAGNALGGILRHPVVRTLGDTAYSLYLLHGGLLYVTFTWIVRRERAAVFTPLEHWSLIALLAPVLVSLCMLSYHYIERPPLAASSRVLDLLRRQGAPAS